MLDDYKSEQPIVYKILTNSIKKNKCSHAYLFELNGYSKGLDLAISFAKFLLCPNNYSNNKKCDNCTQCNKIDSNNFLEFKIIDTDGQWIKKEQLEELQFEFLKKSIVGNKKVYIINHAEKLNASSSNSLLKFIEEPPEGIIAILLTDNMYQLLNTIISRCQIITFKKNIVDNNDSTINKIGKYLFNNSDSYNEFVNDYGIKYLDLIIEYVNFLEKRKEEVIICKNKEFLEVFNDRKKISIAFEILILYYKDALNKKLEIDVDYFNDYIESLENVVNSNSVEDLSEKIKKLVELSINIKYNLNSNLLMDKLSIVLSEV